MGAGFADGQLAFANNLQLNTAVPAHASTWAAEDFSAFPMDASIALAAGMNTYPPVPATQYSCAVDNQEYPPPNGPPPGYLPHIQSGFRDFLGVNPESVDVSPPIHPPGLPFNGAYANATYNQLTPDYFPAPTFTASAPVAYRDPTPSGSVNGTGALYIQAQPVQPPLSYAQPDTGYSVDPRELHPSSSTIWDAETVREACIAPAAHASPGTPSLGYSSGSSMTSASPTTPAASAFPAARVTGKPFESILTTPAPAPIAHPEPATSGFINGTRALYAQSPLSYAKPGISHGVDPRQLHTSSSAIWDVEMAREPRAAYAAHQMHAVPRTPSLGFSSRSSAMSASPTTPTPMGPAFPTAKALGKRKAVDTGFDGDHSTAQTSAQTDPRPVKRSRASSQPARVVATVEPHRGISNQTDAAALTRPIEYSKASGCRGQQHPANLALEVIPGAGAGPSRALPKTRSRVRKQKVVPPDFVPLWKQDLTPEQVEEAARKMDNRELIDNLTEKVDAIVPEQGDKNGKRCMCRWPGCAGSAKREAETGRHIRDIHLGLGPSCPECGRVFRSRTEVNRHVGSRRCNPADKEAEVKVKPRLRRNRRQ